MYLYIRFLFFPSIRRLAEREKGKTKAKTNDPKGGLALATDPEGYNECYPGLVEMNDAIDDSDDEADFSKMDLVSNSVRISGCTYGTEL